MIKYGIFIYSAAISSTYTYTLSLRMALPLLYLNIYIIMYV